MLAVGNTVMNKWGSYFLRTQNSFCKIPTQVTPSRLTGENVVFEVMPKVDTMLLFLFFVCMFSFMTS